MNKSIKKIIISAVITAVTIIIGFAVTTLTFNLFDSLTTNQMRLLFAIDFICLITVGGIFLFLSESKQAKKRKKRQLEKRHNQRIENRKKEFKEINNILSDSGYAA